MKSLYIIGGTMGVGKTAVGQYLKEILPNAVFLDGDRCWDSNPFQVTDETKAIVLDNICHILNNFLMCSSFENIIFCWVLHEQQIIDAIIQKLSISDCDVKVFSLLATEKTLKERLLKDVAKGIRTIDVINRSVTRLPLYPKLHSKKIYTDGKTIQEIANEIIKY